MNRRAQPHTSRMRGLTSTASSLIDARATSGGERARRARAHTGLPTLEGLGRTLDGPAARAYESLSHTKDEARRGLRLQLQWVNGHLDISAVDRRREPPAKRRSPQPQPKPHPLFQPRRTSSADLLATTRDVHTRRIHSNTQTPTTPIHTRSVRTSAGNPSSLPVLLPVVHAATLDQGYPDLHRPPTLSSVCPFTPRRSRPVPDISHLARLTHTLFFQRSYPPSAVQ